MPRAAQPSDSPAQQFLNLVSDPFHSQLQGQAFITSLATALGATALVALLFCVLRPYNSVVYAPRLRHADEKHAPPMLGKGPFAWVSPVVKTKEQILVEKIGMDATVFIRFTCMCRNMFLVLTVVGCGILVPLYVIGGKKNNSYPGISAFMKMTPQFLIGTIFWGLVACAWIMNIVVIAFLWFNYRAVTKLRRHYFDSAEYQTSLHSRTLMVTGIPKSMTTEEGVVRIVDSVHSSGAIPRGSIGRNVKELPDLIEEHDDLVRQLESVLAKYLKNPDKLPVKRPTCKASAKDSDHPKGAKVDAIEYLTARIQKLEKKIKEVRATLDQRNAMNYGFASYSSVEEAHSAAYAARKKHPQNSTITLAPRPSDIIWKNLSLNKASLTTRSITNNLWVALLTLVWIVPNALIAVFLANLGNLGLIWPAFNDQLHRNSKSWALVQGVLAPALTSLFYWVLPMLFRRLAMNAGDKTKTSRDKHVTSKLYAFFVFNNLIVFSLFSAVWQFIAAVINARQQNKDILGAIREGDIWTKLLIAFCNVSPFWASWLLQRNLGAAIDLAQIANLAWGSFQRRFLSPTPRELIELSAPPPFDYASYYNYFLFYSTVALCFATIQPVVLPITAFYFCLDAWLKKYLLMYVFTTKNESGGRFWRVLFNRLLFAIFLSDVVVACLIYARRGGTGNSWITMLATMVPMPIVLIAFKFYCKRAFDDQCAYYSRGNLKEEAMLADDKSTRSDGVKVRFGHPASTSPFSLQWFTQSHNTCLPNSTAADWTMMKMIWQVWQATPIPIACTTLLAIINARPLEHSRTHHSSSLRKQIWTLRISRTDLISALNMVAMVKCTVGLKTLHALAPQLASAQGKDLSQDPPHSTRQQSLRCCQIFVRHLRVRTALSGATNILMDMHLLSTHQHYATTRSVLITSQHTMLVVKMLHCFGLRRQWVMDMATLLAGRQLRAVKVSEADHFRRQAYLHILVSFSFCSKHGLPTCKI